MRLIACLLMAAGAAFAAATERVSLSGDWVFALDPLRQGEKGGWPSASYQPQMWDKVTVPHSWPTDPRYQYTGAAWYRKTFRVPAVSRDRHVRLSFGAVFARARVWLNGTLLGSHEGPYTPFAFDVTSTLRDDNVLVVEADNTWSTTTLPGARPGPRAQDQVYPYYNWGGIVRDVQLEITPKLFIERTRIVPDPDLDKRTAAVRVTAWVRNTSAQAETVRVQSAVDGVSATGSARVAAASSQAIDLQLQLRDVRLWDLDHPRLYSLSTTLSAGAVTHERADSFGIRKIEVRGTDLLLNGDPIRLGGANRAGDHPRFGATEPPDVVEQDGKLLKAAGLELARLQHYAIPPALLDWADRNGLLIVAEAAAWGLVPEQLDSSVVRGTFQSQHREMMERDWNHPSIIAWSVGNEYASDTPAGVKWTRDMIDFTRKLDGSRPVTFASFRADRTQAAPEQEGAWYADFVMINIYGSPQGLLKQLDRLHERIPNKPILISEFGIRVDQVRNEAEREKWFSDVTAGLRTRPWVAGASVWSFNDYRSMYPGTNPNGFRPWGLIGPEREIRGAYRTLEREWSPVVLEAAERGADGVVIVRYSGRNDFPRMTARDYQLRCGSDTQTLPAIVPGEQYTVRCKATSSVSILRPGGYTAATIQVK